MWAKTILILASPDDEHAQHIANHLRIEGHDAQWLDSRAFPGHMALAFDPLRGTGTINLPSGRRLAWDEVRSVYWRNYYGSGGSELPDPEQAYIADNDSRSLLESFLIELPARWVNGWRAFQLHQTKPVQLARVARLGVKTPRTLLTNDPDAVRQFAADHPRCIVKPVQGGDETVRLTREHLTPENLQNLRYAPITAQEEIEGTNIRVFVAGERVLACEVRTPRLDYRSDLQAELLVHELPPAVQQLAMRIARELELLWTGIDFRLSPGGDYVFLEANPSPMFLEFEAGTGLPLTESLIALLTRQL